MANYVPGTTLNAFHKQHVPFPQRPYECCYYAHFTAEDPGHKEASLPHHTGEWPTCEPPGNGVLQAVLPARRAASHMVSRHNAGYTLELTKD